MVYGLMERWGYATPVQAGKMQVTELTLVDGQKRPAARLGLDQDGSAVLEFLREDSTKAAILYAARRGPAAEVLAFGGDNGETGRVGLATSPYGTSLDLGSPIYGPRITLGAEDMSDVPSLGPADSWGVFFEDRDGSFQQPDPHYPVWVRRK